MSSIDFTSFLKLMAHKKASDLFITAGVPPSIKVQGKVSPITQSPLTPQQSRDMVLEVMSPSQREEFEKTHECNFAIGAGARVTDGVLALPAWTTDVDARGYWSTVAELVGRARGTTGIPRFRAGRAGDTLML